MKENTENQLREEELELLERTSKLGVEFYPKEEERKILYVLTDNDFVAEIQHKGKRFIITNKGYNLIKKN